MDKDTVLKVEHLYKKFSRSVKRNLLYGSIDVTKSMLGINYNSQVLRKGEFWSLEDISFELKKGETLGLIGANGSGKSTLLRLINGIFPPDGGKISIQGRIGALIAVGAGFHPYMTGRENIFINGVILGMSKEEINNKFSDIVDFAELGEFIDAPVSTYSSGMFVRLGFSIAIHSLPEIVLIDEVLAVGDAKFQRRCLDKIKELRQNNATSFILVSHNMQNIESMCSKAVLLNKGRQIMLDTPQNIIPVYELMLQTDKEPTEFLETTKVETSTGELNLIYQYPDFGTDEVSVSSIKLIDKNDNVVRMIHADEEVILEASVSSKASYKNSILYVTFNYINDKTNDDKNYIGGGVQLRVDIPEGKSTIRLKFDNATLTTGEYKLGFFLFDETYTNPYSQGYYGYFTSKSKFSTMLRVPQSTPLCWLYPKVEINNN